MEILNSIEGSLENVSTSVVSSDNDIVVLDSTNMVVIEMASLAPSTWPQQELCCCYKNMCNGYELQLPCKLWCVQFIYRLC